MSTTPAPVPVGAIVAGKYRVERFLGAGGMGVVVAATHLQLDRQVALKFLQRDASENAEVVSRFTREAKAAGKIQGEHVARVLDVGVLETGEPYLVMEYLDGEDLAQILTRGGPLSVVDAVDYVLQACEAVAEAHALGIVHRDLKPANLFLAARPTGKPLIKVLDFGISKTPASATDAGLTTTSSVVGSPLYMSPEQMVSAKSVDARSDVWSLGIVLYELLTGAHPFPAESIPALVLAVSRERPKSLRERREDVPAGLEAAILRCLEKQPEERFASVAHLAAAVAPFGSPRAGEAAERIAHILRDARSPRTDPPRSADEYATTARAGTPSNWTPPNAQPSRTRITSRVLFVGIGVLLLAGVVSALLAPSHRGSVDTAVGVPPRDAIPLGAAATVAPPLQAPSASASVELPASATPSASATEKPKPGARPAPTGESHTSVPRMELK